MKKLLSLAVFGLLVCFARSIPLHHLRQVPPAVQITWVTTSTTISIEATTTIVETVKSDASDASRLPDAGPTPFLWEPSLSSISAMSSVSTAIVTKTVSDTLISIVYEQPETVTVTAAPTTITDTSTVSETFTGTPGSFWSAPAQFSNLDSFKIAHFACGEHNLKITSSIPPEAIDDSLAVNPPLFNNIMHTSQDQDDFNGSSSALQLLYPEDSINPGSSPQGGADFYATPLPLADASNVTLEYSVFFPVDFDWVRGGKLPGIYGGHMTCSGGDDATSCFSTRLMWREGGAGELYLYAPKDKQTFALCSTPPLSICDAAYGLSIGRGSFRFARGAWTKVRQTISLNTPGKHDGGFKLEVDGKHIMDHHDVFYRDIPSTTTTFSNPGETNSDEDEDDGGLLSPLLGGVLKPVDSAGVNEGILPPFAKDNNHSASTNLIHTSADLPPLLPFEQHFSGLPLTNDADSALTYNLSDSLSGVAQTVRERATVTQTASQSTVTITNYIWEHAFDNSGKEKAIDGLNDNDNNPEPVAFSGLFFSTFFGGSSQAYATPKDQYTWFKDFAIIINS